MPPALSDDEMSDSGAGVLAHSPPPAKSTSRSRRTSAAPKKAESDVEIDIDEKPVVGDLNGAGAEDDEGEDDEDEDDEMDEDEFVVEKILSHVVQDGNIKFKVKWEGYEKKADQTWEDEDNLQENATEILSEYLESIGGREKIFEETDEAKKSKKRGRPAGGGTPASGGKRSKRSSHPGSETPPASAAGATKKSWKPPAGSWEEHVASIDACHDENTGKLVVYLTWKGGHKTQHGTETIYTRCPQQMLRFYERHVKIVKTTSDHEAETAAAEAEAAAESTKGDNA